MKKGILYKSIAITFILCVLLGSVYDAAIYDPGITGEETAKKGEFNYKEAVFLTGEPILLSGIAKVTESKTSTGSKTTVEYKLDNPQSDAKLERKITYINVDTKDKYGRQITRRTTIDPKVKEVVQIGSDTFNLTSYQYTKSGLTDDKALIRYHVYNWDGRKTYVRAGGGEVIIDIKADTYSYDNYWSTTETSLIYNTLTFKYPAGSGSTAMKETVGTVEYAVSNSSIKNMEYMLNEPSSISFKGGYVLKENQENVVSYIYDVPSMKGWTYADKRSKGRSSYKMATMPTQTRLFSPPIKDVSPSYWAAEDIRAMAALDVISTVETSYFRPLSYVSRAEFTRALIKATNIPEKTNNRSYQLLFDDVEKNHPYYNSIYTAVNAGVVVGTSEKKFSPDDYLTKAQAATIIVRAMGLEEASTESANKTTFADDAKIPSWSKKSINIARKMGIITGNEDNELEPSKLMTRAEVSEMMNRFIKYLRFDIRKEYREKLTNYGR